MDIKRTASKTEAKAGQQPFEKTQSSFLRVIHADRELIPKYWSGENYLDKQKLTINLESFSKTLKQEITKSADSSGSLRLNATNVTYLKLRSKMQDLFARYGIVLLRGNHTMQSYEEMTSLVGILLPDSMNYEGGSNYRGKLDKNVYDTGAPSYANLHYHHEMAYVRESPKNLSFLCLETSPRAEVGATFVSDNESATEWLLTRPLGKKLKEKGLCYVRKLPDIEHFDNKDPSMVYNFWQTSFQSNDPEEATELAKSKGLQVEWEDSPLYGRYMITKFYTSAFEYCPYTKKNLLFASVADDSLWFDSWPGLMNLEHNDRPLKLNFGDDEEMTKKEKSDFIEAYDKFGTPLFWEKGDIAIVCNYRFAHGRPSYSLLPGENRELGVVLGHTFKREGWRKDAW
ncbi:MAG: TauD/TfdA family dioxygenase [Oligoflexales bacterium]